MFKKRSVLLIGVLAFALALTACGGEKLESVGDEQEEVKEIRAVAGTRTSAQILDLFEIDLVGILESQKLLPERYKDVESIGLPMKPDLEKLVAIDPDLFITDSNLKDSMDKSFKERGINTLYLTNNSYEDIFKSIEIIGEKFDREEKAGEIVAEMREKEEEILESIEGQEDTSVLIIFGTPESFMLATENSYTGSVVEKFGARNIGDELAGGGPMPYIPFSMEAIGDADPDVILRLTHVSPEESKDIFKEEFEKDFWQNLKAVREDRVYDLDPENFGVTANINVLGALEDMLEIFADGGE